MRAAWIGLRRENEGASAIARLPRHRCGVPLGEQLKAASEFLEQRRATVAPLQADWGGVFAGERDERGVLVHNFVPRWDFEAHLGRL